VRFCHGANVAEEVPRRQRGQCALRDNGNVIFKRLRAQRLTCQAETSRKMDMSMRHATLRWRYAGLPSARVL